MPQDMLKVKERLRILRPINKRQCWVGHMPETPLYLDEKRLNICLQDVLRRNKTYRYESSASSLRCCRQRNCT